MRTGAPLERVRRSRLLDAARRALLRPYVGGEPLAVVAFDAACRILQRVAQDRLDAPAAEVVDEVVVLHLDLAVRGKSKAPPENLDVQTFVVDVGRLAGFISSKRQPLPGKIWQGYGYLNVQIYPALRTNDMLKESGG